ncbi:MAG: hypothetical protein WC455_11665 [Dehalococcoidia bacterium]|jgi:hypothetical protein
MRCKTCENTIQNVPAHLRDAATWICHRCSCSDHTTVVAAMVRADEIEADKHRHNGKKRGKPITIAPRGAGIPTCRPRGKV